MALNMREADALPRMSVMFGMCAAVLAIANGTPLGTGFLLFLLASMVSPIAALIVTGVPLLVIRRTQHLRLAASWFLFLASLAALGAVVYLIYAASGVSSGH